MIAVCERRTGSSKGGWWTPPKQAPHRNLKGYKMAASGVGQGYTMLFWKSEATVKKEKFSHKNPDFWLFFKKVQDLATLGNNGAEIGMGSPIPKSPHSRSLAPVGICIVSPCLRTKAESSRFQNPTLRKETRGKAEHSEICFPRNKTAKNQQNCLSLHHLTLSSQSWLS